MLIFVDFKGMKTYNFYRKIIILYGINLILTP